MSMIWLPVVAPLIFLVIKMIVDDPSPFLRWALLMLGIV